MKNILALLLLSVAAHASSSEASLRACLGRGGGVYDEAECRETEINNLRKSNRGLSARIEAELQTCTPHVVGYDYTAALREFKAASSNWSAYMRHDCLLTDATFGQGTARSLMFDDCEIDHLRRRHARLQQLMGALVEIRAMLLKENREGFQERGEGVWISCTPQDGANH